MLVIPWGYGMKPSNNEMITEMVEQWNNEQIKWYYNEIVSLWNIR